MGWQALVLELVVSLALSYAFRPDPPDDAQPASVEQIDIPQANAGRPAGVLFGRRMNKSPTVGWYGDLKTKGIKADDLD